MQTSRGGPIGYGNGGGGDPLGGGTFYTFVSSVRDTTNDVRNSITSIDNYAVLSSLIFNDQPFLVLGFELVLGLPLYRPRSSVGIVGTSKTLFPVLFTTLFGPSL